MCKAVERFKTNTVCNQCKASVKEAQNEYVNRKKQAFKQWDGRKDGSTHDES